MHNPINLKRASVIPMLVLTLGAVVGHAADTPKPVFVKASCVDKISSAVVSSLKEAIGDSQKYRLARTLADEGQMDVVLTINVNCTERDNATAIASVFGRAKCFGAANCHLAIDGSSLRSDLCDAKATPECGQALFKAFDEYVSNPVTPPLKLY